jgi:hypothetical protein
MVFYAGMRYTSTVKGSIPKVVQCEQCNQGYVYMLQRSASGEGSSPYFLDNAGAQERAQDRARATLISNLQHGIDEVPCPHCGHVQKHMFERGRTVKYGWMRTAVIVLSIFATAVLFVTALFTVLLDSKASRDAVIAVLAFWGVFGVLFFVVLGIHLLRKKLCANYNPNARPVEERIARGRKVAIPLEEFARMMQQQKQ